MEREVWARIVAFLGRGVNADRGARFTYSAIEVVLTYLWAVLHDRPISWACAAVNWPDDLRPPRLPTPATMSRRLRRPSCAALLEGAHRRLRQGARRGLLHIVDGKPLPIGNHSHDREAGYGRAAGGKAKGYKLHVIAGKNLNFLTWRVRPMQVSEARVAEEMVRSLRLHGYLLGDRFFDNNPLHETCRQRGVQLVAARRYGPGRGLGHHRHSPARRRCIELLEHSQTGFGPQLLHERKAIERLFGVFVSAPYGLHALPPWVRGQAKVTRYVSAKILIFTLIQRLRKAAH